MKRITFLTLFICLLSRVACADAIECSDLFVDGPIDLQQQVTLNRVQRTVDVIYPILLAHTQSPTIAAQFSIRKSVEVLTDISRRSRETNSNSLASQKSRSFELIEMNESVLQTFKDIESLIKREKKFYEFFFPKANKAIGLAQNLPKNMIEIEGLTRQVEEEGKVLNGQYLQMLDSLRILNGEIDFIETLIERFRSDSLTRNDISSISTELQNEVFPVLTQMSVDLFQFKVIISTALEAVNIRIKANNGSLEQARALSTVAYSAFLKNHPELSDASEKKEVLSNVKEKFVLRVGDVVIYKGKDYVVISKNRTGTFDIRKKFDPDTQEYLVMARAINIASTQSDLISRNFKIGDGVKINELNDVGVILGIYPDGDLAVLRYGALSTERWSPKKLRIQHSPQGNKL